MLARTFNTMTEGLRERERERDIFGRVVSPEVREKLLDGKLELGGETRWVAVLFSDIRNFSTTSEKMNPQELVSFLNEYLTEMTNAIRPHGGYLNNFIGDAIVAIFGAPIDQPDKEWRAVAAALTMRQRLVELNQRRVARGEAPIDSGIGIGTGEAVAGQVVTGTVDGFVIGDAVNVAKRLDTLTKEYPTIRFINGPTASHLDGHDATLAVGASRRQGRAELGMCAVLEQHFPKAESFREGNDWRVRAVDNAVLLVR
jgi:class 3 adenylate cyclase